MEILLWIIQGLLALAFLMAGVLKTTTPKEKLQTKMTWAEDYSSGTIKFIGIIEIAGALGLILPVILNIYPIFTPIAAASLALVMLLAAFAHGRRKEFKEIGMNLVLFALSLFVALMLF